MIVPPAPARWGMRKRSNNLLHTVHARDDSSGTVPTTTTVVVDASRTDEVSKKMYIASRNSTVYVCNFLVYNMLHVRI